MSSRAPQPFELKNSAVACAVTVGTFCATILAFYFLHLSTYLRGARDFWPTAQFLMDIVAGGLILGSLMLVPLILIGLMVAFAAGHFLSGKLEMRLWLVVLIAIITSLPMLLLFGFEWVVSAPTIIGAIVTAIVFFRLQTRRWI